MNKLFKIKSLFKETNRKRTIFLNAKSLDELTSILLDKGFVEPFEIEEIEPELPTDGQISYANSLNINIPIGVSKADLSALIDRTINNDSSPSPEFVEYAIDMGFSFSKYAGKASLYNLVYENLELKDKLCFFTFSVYKYLSGDGRDNLMTHPYKDKFYVFVDSMKADAKFVKSAINYRGEELIFFGIIRFSDGVESNGGSINTIAYKSVSVFISETFNTPKTKIFKPDQNSGYEFLAPSNPKTGCASLVAFVAFLFVIIEWILG